MFIIDRVDVFEENLPDGSSVSVSTEMRNGLSSIPPDRPRLVLVFAVRKAMLAFISP